jgi:hypothetical protein
MNNLISTHIKMSCAAGTFNISFVLLTLSAVGLFTLIYRQHRLLLRKEEAIRHQKKLIHRLNDENKKMQVVGEDVVNQLKTKMIDLDTLQSKCFVFDQR